MSNQIAFLLPDPALEQYTWKLDAEHGPVSAAPLIMHNSDLMRSASGAPPEVPPRAVTIHGFHYLRQGAVGPLGAPQPGREWTLEDVTGWRGALTDEVEAFVQMLRSFDASAVPVTELRSVISEQDREFARLFMAVHRGLGPVRDVANRFSRAFTERFGSERADDLEALFHGFPNRTIDRSQALWDLSRIVRANPELKAALDQGRALPESEAASRFNSGMEALLEAYGGTSNADLQDMPTWEEDQTIPLAAIRAYAMQPDEKSPAALRERQAARRDAIEAEVRSLAATDQAVAAMLPLMELAQHLVPNLEDHNLLADQRMASASRWRWLSVGRVLVATGALPKADDIFLLTQDEAYTTLESGGDWAPEAIAERRRLLRIHRASMPPIFLGQVPEQAIDSSFVQTSESRTLRGVAASAGSYRGRARVILDIEEAATLQEGDILVSRTTNPPWTPFFNLISAVVTDSGGSLSHSAVVAREFGIPAVVGTTYATRSIQDGDTITVDGTSGLVVIEESGLGAK